MTPFHRSLLLTDVHRSSRLIDGEEEGNNDFQSRRKARLPNDECVSSANELDLERFNEFWCRANREVDQIGDEILQRTYFSSLFGIEGRVFVERSPSSYFAQPHRVDSFVTYLDIGKLGKGFGMDTGETSFTYPALSKPGGVHEGGGGARLVTRRGARSFWTAEDETLEKLFISSDTNSLTTRFHLNS